ncbi:iron ABC transporter permease [Actinobacteria bacterium YIM 96077]|uniref:Iron ABC transporter permease n=1 Tax=Phytoactinopolyspora halophila TaxID=1981511 RepID=A0A329QPF7_9ACTN|nr:iron ABC transporter permease [Phytoactinopolyspora halophila]AYY12321.1 iron ABC transporter permease [Actinobacteria bacterium YIM 96077]RAW13761.1 iron ABC transporter permease [Phytoactinopolyspora halophila]
MSSQPVSERDVASSAEHGEAAERSLGSSVVPPPPPSRRSAPAIAAFTVLAVLLAGAVIAAVSLGPITIPFSETARVLLGERGSEHAAIIDTIRLPRVLVGLFVGAGLGVAGAVMQALFRNPLAEPGVLGVSSGAAVAAVAVIVSGATAAGAWVLPVGAFLGALGALVLVYAVASAPRDSSVATLLLIGIALNALFGAVVSAIVTNAPDDDTLRGVVFWLNGDLVARTWSHVQIVAIPTVVAVTAVLAFTRDLNVMLLGEAQARASGVDVVRLRRILLILSAVLTGAAVAVAGIIGFVGLVVPHVLRLVLGPDHRILLPGSAILGGSFLVLADLVARMLFSPVTLQTGTVTAFLGSPIFLLLVLRRRRAPRT